MLFVKGASEMVLDRCSKMQLEDGRIIRITDTIREALQEKMATMARQPLRLIAMAYKEGTTLGRELNDFTTSDEAAECNLLKDPRNYVYIERDMVLVGFCGITDPARPEAREAILTCRKAGIRVMMMTGDSKETAIAIGKDVNIFDLEGEDIERNAFTGSEFFSLPEEVQYIVYSV